MQCVFQVAGARAVVASLWKGNDKPIQAMMARFSEDLWCKGLPPGAALYETPLFLLREGQRRDRVAPGRDEENDPKSDHVPPFYRVALVLNTDRP